MDQSLLSPPEAILLLDPRAASGSHCLQAALLELLGKDRFEVEASRSMWREPALVLKPVASLDGWARLVAVVELALIEYASGPSLTRSQVLHALQKRFGYGFARYVHEDVAPELIRRGLLRRRDDKVLWVFPRTRYIRTRRGEALSLPLQRLKNALETFPRIIRDDPEKALRLARSAGVLLVMSPKARKQIPKLRKLIEERGGDVAPLTFSDVGASKGEWDHLLEYGEFALSFDFDSFLDAVDAVGDFTSGSDGSSSDGGDGGGGGD